MLEIEFYRRCVYFICMLCTAQANFTVYFSPTIRIPLFSITCPYIFFSSPYFFLRENQPIFTFHQILQTYCKLNKLFFSLSRLPPLYYQFSRRVLRHLNKKVPLSFSIFTNRHVFLFDILF